LIGLSKEICGKKKRDTKNEKWWKRGLREKGTGNPSAQEVIDAFKAYVQEEAKKYEKEFPPELYRAWYRLYKIPPIQGRGRPWEFKTLTVNHIYAPLAQSNGKILELTRANKAAAGDRKTKLLQFLSETGTRALRMHLGRVLEMAEDSPDRATYEAKIKKRFALQQELELGPFGPK
jgi:P63C domain